MNMIENTGFQVRPGMTKSEYLGLFYEIVSDKVSEIKIRDKGRFLWEAGTQIDTMVDFTYNHAGD